MTPEKAAEIYDILIREAGAKSGDRSTFILHLSKANPPTEYRFQGNLGFGGKFRLRAGGSEPHRVDCYPEDLNPTRRSIIDLTNKALAELDTADRPEYGGDPEVLDVKRYRVLKAGAAE